MGDILLADNSRYRGNLLPQLQRYSSDYDPNRGFIFKEEWAGISYNEMLVKQTAYQIAGVPCRITYNNTGISTLEAETPQQYTLDTWQIVGNDELIDQFSHPTMIALLNASPDNWATLQQDFDDAVTTAALITKLTSSGFSSIDANTIARFYSLKQRGSTEFERSQYVLRHTTNAPNRYNVNIADFNVNQIYSPARLLTEVQSSSLWIFPMPNSYAYFISNIPALAPQTNYFWGWKKKPATRTTAPNARIDITQEYVLELWSTDDYPNPVT